MTPASFDRSSECAGSAADGRCRAWSHGRGFRAARFPPRPIGRWRGLRLDVEGVKVVMVPVAEPARGRRVTRASCRSAPPSVLPAISPSRGEIGTVASAGLRASVAMLWSEKRAELPISPLEGEMSGRTEGGVRTSRINVTLKTSEYPGTPLARDGHACGRVRRSGEAAETPFRD